MRAISSGPALLGDLVTTYQIAFRLEPAHINVFAGEVEIALELELAGTHEPHHAATCRRGCMRCQQVLMALLEIADWAVPTRNEAPTGRGSYEKVVRYAMSEGSEPQAALGIWIVGRRKFPEADDGWGLEFLMHIREFLQSLGCRPMATRAPAEELPLPDGQKGLAEARA